MIGLLLCLVGVHRWDDVSGLLVPGVRGWVRCCSRCGARKATR